MIIFENLIIHSLYPIIFLFFNSIFQLLFIRYFKFRYLISTLIGFFVGLALLIFFEYPLMLKKDIMFSSFILNICNYFLMSFAYFVFITTGKTSLRMRLLTEINTFNYIGITKEEIFKKYNGRNITDVRIARLIRNKQIQKINNRYFFKFSLTLIIALGLDCAKYLYFGKKKCLYKGFK